MKHQLPERVFVHAKNAAGFSERAVEMGRAASEQWDFAKSSTLAVNAHGHDGAIREDFFAAYFAGQYDPEGAVGLIIGANEFCSRRGLDQFRLSEAFELLRRGVGEDGELQQLLIQIANLHF